MQRLQCWEYSPQKNVDSLPKYLIFNITDSSCNMIISSELHKRLVMNSCLQSCLLLQESVHCIEPSCKASASPSKQFYLLLVIVCSGLGNELGVDTVTGSRSKHIIESAALDNKGLQSVRNNFMTKKKQKI